MLENFLSTNINLTLPSPRDHMLWCGDFNHHHPLWEEDSNRRLFSQPESIDPLLDLLATYNMRLTLPLGIPTYKTTQGNWTRPDNVWRSNNPLDPIVICDIKPSLHPPCADHLPIITEFNMLIRQAQSFPTHNMHKANFLVINKKLRMRLEAQHPAKCIHNKNDIDEVANNLVHTADNYL